MGRGDETHVITNIQSLQSLVPCNVTLVADTTQLALPLGPLSVPDILTTSRVNVIYQIGSQKGQSCWSKLGSQADAGRVDECTGN